MQGRDHFIERFLNGACRPFSVENVFSVLDIDAACHHIAFQVVCIVPEINIGSKRRLHQFFQPFQFFFELVYVPVT